MTDDYAIDWDTALEGFQEQDLPIEAGEYVMEVEMAYADKASSGSPMIVTRLRVIGGPQDGRTTLNHMVAKPGAEKNLKIFTQQLISFGIPKAWLDSKPSARQVAEQLQGKRANVKLEIDGIYNDVKRISRLASTVPGAPPVSTGPVPPPPVASPTPPQATPQAPTTPSAPAATTPVIPPPPDVPPPLLPSATTDVEAPPF